MVWQWHGWDGEPALREPVEWRPSALGLLHMLGLKAFPPGKYAPPLGALISALGLWSGPFDGAKEGAGRHISEPGAHASDLWLPPLKSVFEPSCDQRCSMSWAHHRSFLARSTSRWWRRGGGGTAAGRPDQASPIFLQVSGISVLWTRQECKCQTQRPLWSSSLPAPRKSFGLPCRRQRPKPPPPSSAAFSRSFSRTSHRACSCKPRRWKNASLRWPCAPWLAGAAGAATATLARALAEPNSNARTRARRTLPFIVAAYMVRDFAREESGGAPPDEEALGRRCGASLAISSACSQPSAARPPAGEASSLSPSLPPSHGAVPPRRRIGLLGATFSGSQLLTSFLIGRLSDVVGRKPIMLLGNASCVLSAVLFGLSSSYGQAVASRVVGGLLNGVIGGERGVHL